LALDLDPVLAHGDPPRLEEAAGWRA
jgi:hypothetical protein